MLKQVKADLTAGMISFRTREPFPFLFTVIVLPFTMFIHDIFEFVKS